MPSMLENLLGSGHWKFWSFVEKYKLLKRLFRFHWEHKLTIKGTTRGYHDPCYLLLYAAFECLNQFIEDPMTHYVNWNFNPYQKTAWRKANKLWYWWNKVRPSRRDPIHEIDFDLDEIMIWTPTDHNSTIMSYKKDDPRTAIWFEACRQSNILEKQWDREDQSMLHRLIGIRLFLWA